MGRVVACVLCAVACRGDFDQITHATDAANDADGTAVTYPLVVTVTGPGQVTSDVGAIACPGTCSAELPVGITVTLTASTAVPGGFDGYSGDCTGPTCAVVMTAPRAVDSAFSAKNIVFVTSTFSTPGSIGSLAAADVICTQRAQARALPGTYVAWLSSSTVNAKDRLGSARGWVRVDGLPVADTVAALTSGALWYPPRLDETGADVGGSGTNVVTGTSADGTAAPTGSCSDWASTAGNTTLGRATGGTSIWTEYTQTACSSSTRLYCFGVSQTNPVHAEPVAGRVAFITATWPPSGGLAGADAQCAADAAAAGLPGSFRALLATTTATAASRFSDGTPWVRRDGIPIAANLAQLATGLTSPIEQLASGAYLTPGRTWGGATAVDQLGTTATCKDWTSALGTDGGMEGQPASSGTDFFYENGTSSCNNPGRGLYCLEQ